MSNLAAEIEGTIRAHRLPALGDVLPQDEFILPRYADLRWSTCRQPARPCWALTCRARHPCPKTSGRHSLAVCAA